MSSDSLCFVCLFVSFPCFDSSVGCVASVMRCAFSERPGNYRKCCTGSQVAHVNSFAGPAFSFLSYFFERVWAS